MSKEQTAKKERFLREVERQLLRKGLDSEMMEDGILNVKWHGQLLCDVDGDGMVCFPSKTVRGVDADASLQTVIQIASQVREYMPIFARAPALKAIGLEGSYKILADFGDAVLAGRLGKKGANFVTWEWDFDRNGVHMGHYFIEDYSASLSFAFACSSAASCSERNAVKNNCMGLLSVSPYINRFCSPSSMIFLIIACFRIFTKYK